MEPYEVEVRCMRFGCETYEYVKQFKVTAQNDRSISLEAVDPKEAPASIDIRVFNPEETLDSLNYPVWVIVTEKGPSGHSGQSGAHLLFTGLGENILLIKG